MKTRTGQKLKLTTVEELLGVPATESSTEIDIDMIHIFKNHPFKVLDDEKMSDLVESIRINRVLSPVLVRPDGEESYEMISGHRRMHAAKIVGLTMIPAIVREGEGLRVGIFCHIKIGGTDGLTCVGIT